MEGGVKGKKYIGPKPARSVMAFTVGKRGRDQGTGISRQDSQRKWTLLRGEEAPIGGASLDELERRLKAA